MEVITTVEIPAIEVITTVEIPSPNNLATYSFIALSGPVNSIDKGILFAETVALANPIAATSMVYCTEIEANYW